MESEKSKDKDGRAGALEDTHTLLGFPSRSEPNLYTLSQFC
jgi:hypothetical protein